MEVLVILPLCLEVVVVEEEAGLEVEMVMLVVTEVTVILSLFSK
jgi:hypothetical protein